MSTSSSHRMGIVGCGDFLRLQKDSIDQTQGLTVAALYDPMEERSRAYTADWKEARICSSAEELIDADDIDIIALFVPPWLRKDLLVRAARNGKQIITTKPLGSTIEDCQAMVSETEKAGVCAGVIYNRTGNPLVSTLRGIFSEGSIGKLALFKQDWLHHYPHWNTWALDPEKNGGPFMDAMIHNLNIARHLMEGPATEGFFFSDRHAHPDLPCADTEFLKLDFAGCKSAHLFITWAADLNLLESGGNYREHIDISYAITDKGWRLTWDSPADNPVIRATRMGEVKTFPLTAPDGTHFDELLQRIDGQITEWDQLASLREAAEDIRIIRLTSAKPGQRVSCSE